MATSKRASGVRKAPARKPASKPAAAKAPAAAAAPAVAPRVPGAGVELICIAKGSRTFGSASGRRYRVVEGEHFTIDLATAKLLLKSDPEAFVFADQAPPADEPAATATGPITVADLTAGGTITKPDTDTELAAGETVVPLADAATEAASSGEGNEGGSEPADEPAATATGEAGTPPSGEADAPGAEVLT